MILIKIHKAYRPVVAICDKELVGKSFQEGKKKIDLRKNFFDGVELETKELVKQIHKMQIEDATFNIVGKKSIELALKEKIISKKGIIEIEGIPVALILM